MKRIMVFLITLFVTVGLVACGSVNTEVGITADELDIKELVNEYSVGHFEDEAASITATELIVTKDGEELVYDLPEDEFFVSIAPYIYETHPCTYHSLTSCQGELVEEEFDVFIEDADGNVIVDETLATLENGFIDLWLPRDKTYHITIAHEDKIVTSEFSTFEEDATCITTMQLM